MIWRFTVADDLKECSKITQVKGTMLKDYYRTNFGVRLLRNSSGNFSPDLSFDKSASLEHLFGLARASLVAVSKLYFSFGCSGGDYTSSCPLCQVSAKLACDWFSFAKRRAPSLACIDDKRSCMKHWKSGFFLVDRRAISDAMVWRHPDAAIDDPRPGTGSFNMDDVRCLSAHVIKLRDMPEGVLVLSRLSRVWKNCFCDPVLRGADRNVMGIHDFLSLPEWTGAEVQEEPHLDDLAVGTPSSKITAKAKASQKLKASTYGVASSHVAKRTRSALAQSFDSTTRPNLFVGDSDDESDGDDDACVEILLVTPLRYAVVIPPSGNQGRSSAAPTTEALTPEVIIH
ncbi:hypothetical protein Tco_0173159 [Tanacetum coccineum]